MILCWTLVDRDEAGEAAAELDRATFEPAVATSFMGATFLDARGRARLALGDRRGIDDLLEAGRRIVACGLDNPACFPWRSAAATGLAAIGDRAEALRLCRAEVRLARGWAAPRALSLALRAEAVLTRGPAGLELLHEALGILEGSPALLERARTLIELGSALRRDGRRIDARPLLQQGLELAQTCGAPRESAHARTELRAAGGRPRTPLRVGLDALTPSEHRIAAQAAEGRSNPQIAQELFVTVKTVEMHLSAAYRKLGVRSRTELGRVLTGDAGPGRVATMSLSPGTRTRSA